MGHPISLMTRHDGPSHDTASWALILVIVGLIITLQIIDPFTLVWGSALTPAAFAALLQAMAWFYTRWRPNRSIVTMIVGLQQMILFTALGASLSYMVAAQGGIMWDSRFQSWDRAIGFDWRTYLDWVNARPGVGAILSFAYSSLIPQMILIILALGFTRRERALRITLFAAMLTGLITIVISGFMPAMSNFVALKLQPQDYANLHPAAAFVHVQDIEALRSGALRTLSIQSFQGIITFPSYHAGLAAAFAYGYTNMRWMKWPGLILAGLTIIATPIDGGHYLVDVMAGISIAAISILVAQRSVGVALVARTVSFPSLSAFRSSPFRRLRGSSVR
jgi:hypothetical protein